MRIKVVADGRVLQGTAKQIVEAMHSIAFGQENRTLSEYVDWAVDMARRMTGVELVVEGETDEEKSASLVKAIIDAGLAEKL
jgi:predicted RNA-binding protein with PIN domain